MLYLESDARCSDNLLVLQEISKGVTTSAEFHTG